MMKSTTWSLLYLLAVAVFSSFYYCFWLNKPDSFIINPELNVQPFYSVNKLLWSDENTDYQLGNGISLNKLQAENDNYFYQLSHSKNEIFKIEQEMSEIKSDLDKLDEIRNAELDKNKHAYEAKMLAPILQREGKLEVELVELNKYLPAVVKTKADVELVRDVGNKRVELAEIRVEKAQQIYEVAEFFLSNLVGFMSKETIDRYAYLNQRESDLYQERYLIEKNIRDARSLTFDRLEKDFETYRSRLNYFDFLYYSIGISTTTTFGDIVANNRVVRIVVSVQLLICIFIVAGFVNSVVAREVKASRKANVENHTGA